MTGSEVVTILAGGTSRRMRGTDKAVAKVNGTRLVDCVAARVRGQAGDILLSAKQDYETDLRVVEDEYDAFAGPVAGLYAVARWVARHRPRVEAFFSVPVDAPCLPLNLTEQLKQPEGTAIVETPMGLQPTFGYWNVKSVLQVLSAIPRGETLSLKDLASQCNAVHVFFSDSAAFVNINTLEDARRLEKQLCSDDHSS